MTAADRRFGTGWLSGTAALFLGICVLGAVLCIRFPALLTVPEARSLYPLAAIRLAIHICAIGAFVRLGWRDRAQELTRWFLTQQKPIGWRQWPEVVRREDRVPHFLGDLPHTWVGSDFVRSVLDMLAYEREDDESLVLGAGVRSRPSTTIHSSPDSHSGRWTHSARTRASTFSRTLRAAT